MTREETIKLLEELGLINQQAKQPSNDPVYEHWYTVFTCSKRWTDNHQEQWKKYSAEMARLIAEYVKQKVSDENRRIMSLGRFPGQSSDGWD